jgi:hypothetical protein
VTSKNPRPHPRKYLFTVFLSLAPLAYKTAARPPPLSHRLIPEEDHSIRFETLHILLDDFHWNDLTSTDLSISRRCLADITAILAEGFSVTQLPPFVIPRSLEIASLATATVYEVVLTLKIISHVSCLPDELAHRFLSSSVSRFLVDCASECSDPVVLSLSVAFLADLTVSTKPVTAGMIFELPVVDVAMRVIAEAKGQRLTEVIGPGLALLANWLVLGDIEDSSAREIVGILGEFCDRAFPDLAVCSVHAFASAVHASPSRLLPLIDDVWPHILLQLLDCRQETLCGHVFAALDNLAFCDVRLAILTIAGGFFGFELPREWSVATFGIYCRVVWTLARRLGEHRSVGRDHVGEECIRAVRERAPALVPVLVGALDEGPCQVREAAASALCAIINLNDSELLHVAMQGNLAVVGNCAEMLLIRNPGLASSILCALVKLCEFGDRIAFVEENPFLAAAREADIDNVMEEVAEMYEGEEALLGQIARLAQEMHRSRSHEEVDFG